MTDHREPEATIPIRGLWGRIRNLGGIVVALIGMKQQEAVDAEQYERTPRTYTWYEGFTRHSFTGTPEQYRKWRGHNKE